MADLATRVCLMHKILARPALRAVWTDSHGLVYLVPLPILRKAISEVKELGTM